MDHDFLVTTDDGGTGTGGAASTAEKQPLTLVLDHLRSAFNVGAIFRTADCLGISRLVLCGYTATPDDAQVQRTTMGAHAHVAWEWKKNTAAAVDELRAAGVAGLFLLPPGLCWTPATILQCPPNPPCLKPRTQSALFSHWVTSKPSAAASLSKTASLELPASQRVPPAGRACFRLASSVAGLAVAAGRRGTR